MMEVTASVLAGQRFLSGLRAEQLDALAATASEVTFPAGYRIFADGGYVGSFWLIESGHVALDAQVPGECPAVVGTVGMGGLLGWSWLVPPYRWRFGAVCATGVKAIQFTRLRCGSCARPIRLWGTSSPGGCSAVLAERLTHTRAKLIAKTAY